MFSEYVLIGCGLLSVVALVFAWLAFRQSLEPYRPHRHTAVETKLAELELELVEVLDRVDKLTTVAKRKYSRDVARKGRENGSTDEETDEQWKKRKLAEYMTGRRP